MRRSVSNTFQLKRPRASHAIAYIEDLTEDGDAIVVRPPEGSTTRSLLEDSAKVCRRLHEESKKYLTVFRRDKSQGLLRI